MLEDREMRNLVSSKLSSCSSLSGTIFFLPGLAQWRLDVKDIVSQNNLEILPLLKIPLELPCSQHFGRRLFMLPLDMIICVFPSFIGQSICS